MQRVLILTASFGDGHNSAAEAMGAALERVGAGRLCSRIHDLVREAEPIKGAWLQRGYKFTITHWPWVWRTLYYAAELIPFEDDRMFFLRRVERRLVSVINEFRPTAVICTFPLYPHLLARLFGASGPRCPVFTVVTDSIAINEVWLSSATNFYLTPEELSSAELRRRGVAADHIFASGFPVHPAFGDGAPSSPPEHFNRVLYFPSVSRRLVRRAINSLLSEGPPDLDLTVILGRHEDRLRPVRAEMEQRYPDRQVRWFGWTTEVAAFIQSHHCVLGKAGGATTHECAAAGRPFLITQIVPGQEEGNAELVQRRGSGCWVPNPAALGPLLARLQGSAQWKKMCAAAWSHRRPQAALAAARFVLDHLD